MTLFNGIYISFVDVQILTLLDIFYILDFVILCYFRREVQRMEPNLLLLMLSERMFAKLIITILVFGLSHYVTYTFGFNIIKVKISFKQLISAICIMTFYSLFGKLFFNSLALYSTIMIPLIIILLAVTEKKANKEVKIFSIANFLKLSWAALLMILSNAIGFVSVIAPLSLHKEVAIFFNTTIDGYNAACAIETLFVALLLFVLIKFPGISLIPPIKEKIDWIDVVAFITSAAMFSLTFQASVTLVTSLMKDSKNAFGNLLYQWLIIVIAVSGHFITIRHMKMKNVKLVEENERITEEKNQIAKENERITEEKNQIARENERINEEKNQISLEKAEIEATKAHLEELLQKMKQDKEELRAKVEELFLKNINGEYVVVQELLDKYNKYACEMQNIQNILNRLSNPNVPSIDGDGEENPINILAGIDNQEIARILGLDQRDMEIAHMLMCGKSNKDIGDRLSVQANTTANYVSAVLGKFDLRERNRFLPYIIKLFINKKLIPTKKEG